jgi:hypothetical protein
LYGLDRLAPGAADSGAGLTIKLSTMLGFIPVDPEMIAGTAPCKRFLDEVGTGLRQAEPAACRGERRRGMFSGRTMFIGMLVAMSVIRVRAAASGWVSKSSAPTGSVPSGVGTPRPRMGRVRCRVGRRGVGGDMRDPRAASSDAQAEQDGLGPGDHG